MKYTQCLSVTIIASVDAFLESRARLVLELQEFFAMCCIVQTSWSCFGVVCRLF